MIGPIIILALTTTGLLIAGSYIYGLIDTDRLDKMQEMDDELAQVLSLRSKDHE
jgi:hypothetical protein